MLNKKLNKKLNNKINKLIFIIKRLQKNKKQLSNRMKLNVKKIIKIMISKEKILKSLMRNKNMRNLINLKVFSNLSNRSS